MNRNGRSKYFAFAGAALFLCVVSFGMVSMSDSDLMLDIYRGIDTFSKVYKEIALNYVDQINPQKFMRAGIDGMLKTLDPYTVFIGENEGDELDLVTTGKYAGVGITIGLRDGAVTVLDLVEGYSAAKQGIQIGDRIVEVEGKSVVGAAPDAVRNLVRGEVGTEVHMKVEREGEPKPLEFVLVREEIPVRNVTYAGYVRPGVGYIRLERFSRTAGEDVRDAIKKLQEEGDLKAVVLDLRGNPGGLLDIAVSVVSDFVPENSLVVSTRGRTSESDRKYYSTGTPLLPNTPLAILVDDGSASASEIVAGAIQDLDRGLIVGQRSFGKGLVQTITRLSETASLKITTARYYTPSGRCIQEIDYSHRTKDGVFATVPDSLRSVFRTSHDRIVRSAGGIQPDSVVEEEHVGKVIAELMRKAMFFGFANRYAVQHKTLPKNFEVSDSLLNEFENYLKEKHFEYQEDSEVKLGELKDIATKERYSKAFLGDVDQMENLIREEKARKMQRYKDEMRMYLGASIEGRIYGDSAEIASTLPDDRQLNIAIDLLRNRKTYDKLLATKPGKGPETEE